MNFSNEIGYFANRIISVDETPTKAASVFSLGQLFLLRHGSVGDMIPRNNDP